MIEVPHSSEERGSISSPFRYPGNQIYALHTLLSLIPPHSIYFEPFCGGASTFFAKAKVARNWLNDIDPELIKTYIMIRDQPDKLIAFLSKQSASPEQYAHFRDGFRPVNDFEIAARWFYLNRTSRLESMSMSWEQDDQVDFVNLDWEKLILACSRKLQGVTLTSGDFESVIASAPEGAFLFIAPPYSIHHSSAQNKLHKYPFEKEAHFRLAQRLKSLDGKVKFLVTYNEHPDIRALYAWGDHIALGNLPNTHPQKEELVIMNYKV